jgi:predicted DNA-binding transcriptional regulator AlpA
MITTDAYAELERTLPAIISRAEVPKLTGGPISAGRLANLDCEGKGPRRITLGRKVGYTRADFIAWMRSRGGQSEAEG